jgi:hypothetical protein
MPCLHKALFVGSNYNDTLHMTKYLKKSLAVFFLTFLTNYVFAQDKEFDQYTITPKDTSNKFPLDYKISRPRLEYPNWDIDYDVYNKFLTPAIRKTQASFSYNDKGVIVSVIPNAIMTLSQLDTSTAVSDPNQLVGTWRMIKFRSIRFNDSIYLPTKTYYRLPDTLLHDKSNDEAFAVFTDNNFKLYAKEEGKTSYKKMMSAKYKVENSRFMMVYKFVKASGGVSMYGIDEKGYLILNYPKVIENVKKGEYFSYYSIIEQYIFQKVK